MNKLSKLTQTTLLLAFFFALDKGLAILRQVIIARQFGLARLDAYNAANNVPDLLYVLISGGALAVAFIPALSEALTTKGRSALWDLFSRITNLAFLVTAGLAILVVIFARPLVGWELGIAPGFTAEQKNLVVNLMRLDLIGTLIFSISGLVMAGLQANQHFLFPAMAPPFYNIGQIFGALILAPEKGISIAGVTLPAYGMGVYGLVYGVIIGAGLHLLIQVPGLIRYKFHWTPLIGINTPEVRKVLVLFGPRLLTMLSIQLIFLVRDNLASRLQAGAVTALTYGWMLQQVPETLIGTAIGMALLPTLSEQAARLDWQAFRDTLNRACQVLFALTIPVAVVLAIGLKPLVARVFGFDVANTDLLMWVTRGFLVGLAGHSLNEVVARAFYARQKPLIPLYVSLVNLVIYVILGFILFRLLGPAGISLTDSIAFTTQAVLLLVLLNRRLPEPIRILKIVPRTILAALLGGGAALTIMVLGNGRIPALMVGVLSLGLGAVCMLPPIWKEVRLLLRL